MEEENLLEDEMKKLMEGSEELARNFRIVSSFKGVGTVTAAVLIIYTANFTKFRTARQFACFCGIAPFGKDSGTSVKVKPHVSHLGHKGVKAAIVQACKSAMVHNPAIKEYADRLKRKGKPHGIVMNNVKNKVLHIIFKMIESGTLWDSRYHASHKPKQTAEEPLRILPDKHFSADVNCSNLQSLITNTPVFDDNNKILKNFHKNILF